MTSEEYKLAFTTQDEVTPANEYEQVIYQIISEAANDTNSSQFREGVTKILMGLRPSARKHGYDDDELPIEVKPQNYYLNTKNGRLSGAGSFNDFRWSRHQAYSKDNVRVISSGFSCGKILYIAEFSYNAIAPHIEERLHKYLPNGDEPNKYARTIGFSYLHWTDHPHIFHYVRPTIDKYKDHINKKFYKKIIATL